MRRSDRKNSLFRFFPDSNKGLSTVVTSLLLILLSIVAIGIIWVVVRNLIGDATTGIGFEKFSLNLGISSAYIDGGEVKVVVRRSVGAGNLTGVYFIFHNGTSSSSVKRSVPMNELDERTFTFSSAEVGGISEVKLVSVSPIYRSGGEDTIAGITDTAQIQSFVPGGAGATGETTNETTNETGGTAFCGDGNCDPGELEGGCSQDCIIPDSCNGIWEGDLESFNAQCDGGPRCLVGCACPIGYTGDGNGGCVSEPSLNRGVIESVWPFGAVKYLDSEDLPKDSVNITSYMGKFVNFSGAGGETRCLSISYAEYLSDSAYNKSYIRLELPSTVLPGDIYEIWVSSSCGA